MKLDFNKLASSHRAIRIRIKHPEDTHYDGVVLKNTKTFIIFREIIDFEPNGIIVLPKKWIKGIRNGELEKTLNDILRTVIKVESLSIGESYVTSNKIQEIASYLQTNNIWPSVEVVRNDEGYLYIGPITGVSKNTFKIYCYDATGKWEKEYELKYNEIFKIEIASRYVRHFNEYMKRKVNNKKLC